MLSSQNNGGTVTRFIVGFALISFFVGAIGCDSTADTDANPAETNLQENAPDEESDGSESEATPDAGEETQESEESTETPEGPTFVEEAPLLLDAVEPGKLIQVEPGGDTSCSRGTPFRFFVRGGTVNKVVIDFGGGGACWDEVTCSVAGAIFQEEAPDFDTINGALALGALGGMYNADEEQNPFKDWYLVHIPYCTGDIHWGNTTHVYNDDLTIEHKGNINAQTVLSWIEDQFEAPSELFVTGCSAGSYGAILHSASLADQYPNTKITVMGDSGAGIITEDWFAESFPNWNVDPTLPDWYVALGKEVADLEITDVYADIANHYPNVRFSHYSSAFDSNQEFYLQAMGGDVSTWSGQLFEVLTEIYSRTENFTYYISPGEMHCVMPYDLLYAPVATEVPVISWVKDLMDNPELPAPIQCEGDVCTDDLWCQECATAENPGWYCYHCKN